jgi:autotransporter-associated beta strand protein
MDGKVFFGGGRLSPGATYTGVVDIYDTATNSWSTANLSMTRSGVRAAAADGIVIFGGGYVSGDVTNRVDIYDVAANTWTTSTLSVARYASGAASVGSKVLFGGGWIQNGACGVNRVDVYDTATNSWSIASLSQPRDEISAASADGKVLFGGGRVNGIASNQVDIYDSTNGQWSTTALSQARSRLAANSAQGKVFFAGGWESGPNYTPSNVVDIYDATDASWCTANLSRSRTGLAATSAGNKVFFAGGVAKYNDTASYSDVVDIYTVQNYDTITSSQAFTLVDKTTVAGRMQLNAGANLNLDGYDLAVGSMSGVATINLSNRTLTVGMDNTNSSYLGGISGNGSLFKAGDGLLTLSGDNSYLGLTTVNAGELDLVGPDAWTPVTDLGGAYISSGQLVFDYVGTSDPFTTIVGLLGAKINGAMPLFITDDVVNRRVIVSTVPEPSTLVLLGVGAISLLGYARRRPNSGK